MEMLGEEERGGQGNRGHGDVGPKMALDRIAVRRAGSGAVG
jgi:hypothetical protein